MQHQRVVCALIASLGFLVAALAAAETPATPSAAAAELVAQEELRVAVEQAFELSRAPSESADEAMFNFVAAADALEQTGPDVVPFVIDELDQTRPGTFLFCAYTLGRLGTPQAKAALKRAMERAEQQRGKFAKNRKAWAGYALGLAGEAEAVRLLNEGRHVVGHFPVYGEMSSIEIAAVQTAPESVPLLLEQVDRLGEDETLPIERGFVIRALGRTRDPRAVPKLIEVMQTDPLEPMRRQALRSLSRINAPEVQPALIAALGDEGSLVRKSAALALDTLQFPSSVEPIVAHLETEQNAMVRGPLYHALAVLRGPQALGMLSAHWPSPDPVDRLSLIRAVGQMRSAETLDILKQALGDTDSRVYLQALSALRSLGTPEAVKILLERLRDPRWPLAQTSIELLGDLGESAAAPTIAERLLKQELAGVVTDPSAKPRIALMCETLVALGYHSALEGLRGATGRQTDGGLVLDLEDVIARLELIRRNGDDVKAWIDASRAPGESTRLLAYRRLGELGGPAAAATLAERFGRVETAEGVTILEALGRVDTPAARELVRRVLLAAEFDGLEQEPLRAMAAWSARRLAGPDMLDALEASVERRDGRDAIVGVYLAVAAGKDATPTLTRSRLRLMRYMSGWRGKELARLDRILQDLPAGRSIEKYDVAPPFMPY